MCSTASYDIYITKGKKFFSAGLEVSVAFDKQVLKFKFLKPSESWTDKHQRS